MKIVLAGEGERLKLGPPLRGEVTLLVRPEPPHNALAMGTQTLPSGQTMEAHRHLQFDEVWFVHKGQGRATVEEVTKTVVPGATISIPRGAWHSLRNTGTGLLQIVWMAAPSGMEQLMRELSQQHAATTDPAALQAIAQRYGTEFRADHGVEGSSPARPASPHRHRHRRGRRGAGKGDRPPTAPATPAALSAAVSTSEALQKPPPAAAKAPRHPAPQHRGSRHRHAHVKEVYMGGHWIKVTGEGPIISTGGHEASQDTGGS